MQLKYMIVAGLTRSLPGTILVRSDLPAAALGQARAAPLTANIFLHRHDSLA